MKCCRTVPAGLTQTAATLFNLTPDVICNPDHDNIDISQAVLMYNDDLPSPELVDQELARWKIRYFHASMGHIERVNACGNT